MSTASGNNTILYRGTDKAELNCLMNGEFNDLSWWTDNINNLRHYYNGAWIVMVIQINENDKQDYMQDKSELKSEYTFGSAEMICPKNSVWYSIGKDYMEKHAVSINELTDPIFTEPDEDDDDEYEMGHSEV